MSEPMVLPMVAKITTSQKFHGPLRERLDERSGRKPGSRRTAG